VCVDESGVGEYSWMKRMLWSGKCKIDRKGKGGEGISGYGDTTIMTGWG
jgi:hypothetical protein